MDFFEQQEHARRSSRRLVAWYLLAVAATVASYGFAFAGFYALASLYGTGSAHVPWRVPLAAAAAAGIVVLAVSARRWWQLREGGTMVARLLNARLVDAGRCGGAERRLLNVVEEMAVASGLAVPSVYLMPGEGAVNALVAGHSPNEAVIVVTRGALDKLSRDELQGVMGHEFSHLLNGDMALNLRLAALVAGLSWVGERGEALVFTKNPVAAWLGLVIAFVGFPGTLAASALRCAVSREREFLADAASVQFTRNPEGIAGALDSLLALRAHTRLAAAQAEEVAHMFFAPAVTHWFAFPTHPPLATRIYRVHPRFHREGYRERRHGHRQEVAVIDGAGHVVQQVRAGGLAASVGRPEAGHLAFGRRLLAALPGRLREALHRAADAERVLFALGGFERKSGTFYADVQALGSHTMLALAELALPAVKAQPQPARDRFIAEFSEAVQADGRVSLRELVLLTFLRQHLRAGAGGPIRVRYRAVTEVAGAARVVLWLLAALGSAPQAAFAKGAAIIGLDAPAPASAGAPAAGALFEALERLRHLAPLAKPAVLRACIETVSADGTISAAEGEVVRAVAAALDCPLPPLVTDSKASA